jgi:3-oxoacyl-[acyl-carrier protein] reductase
MTNNIYQSVPLAGQSALVTGASSGIGAEIANALAAAGANVGVNYAGNRNGADAVVRQIVDKGGNAIAWAGHVNYATSKDGVHAQQ